MIVPLSWDGVIMMGDRLDDDNKCKWIQLLLTSADQVLVGDSWVVHIMDTAGQDGS